MERELQRIKHTDGGCQVLEQFLLRVSYLATFSVLVLYTVDLCETARADRSRALNVNDAIITAEGKKEGKKKEWHGRKEDERKEGGGEGRRRRIWKEGKEGGKKGITRSCRRTQNVSTAFCPSPSKDGEEHRPAATGGLRKYVCL